MKKIMLAGFILLISVGGAHATVKWEGGKAASGGTPTGAMEVFKVSNGVTLQCSSINVTYAATSAHDQGTRLFGAGSGDTIMYFKDRAPGSTIAPPQDSSAGQFASGWSAL